MIIPYFLANLGMGGGIGVHNPVVDGGYGTPARLLSQGFGPQPSFGGAAAASRSRPLIASGSTSARPTYVGVASISVNHQAIYGVSGVVTSYFAHSSPIRSHATLAAGGLYVAPQFSGSAALTTPHPLLHGEAFLAFPGYAGDAELLVRVLMGGEGISETVLNTADAELVVVHPALDSAGAFVPLPGAAGGGSLAHRVIMPFAAGNVTLPVYAGSAELVVRNVVGGSANYFLVTPNFAGSAALRVNHPIIGGDDNKTDAFVFKVTLRMNKAAGSQ